MLNVYVTNKDYTGLIQACEDYELQVIKIFISIIVIYIYINIQREKKSKKKIVNK